MTYALANANNFELNLKDSIIGKTIDTQSPLGGSNLLRFTNEEEFTLFKTIEEAEEKINYLPEGEWLILQYEGHKARIVDIINTEETFEEESQEEPEEME